MKKKSITLIALLMVAVISVASSSVYSADTIFSADGFSYTLLNDNFVSIYDWDGGSDTLVIPSTLDQSLVKEIRDRCFLYRDDFSELDLSQADYLNRIGISAFKHSTVSGTLNIPPQVRTVASGAFENCDSLEILYFNAMTDVVSSQSFYDCDALSEVYLTEGVKTIEINAFSDCDNLSVVVIPDTVTAIDDYAFGNCPELVIYCYTDSYAQQYAEEKGIEYVLIDAPEPPPETEPPTETPETELPTDAPETEAPTQEPETQAPDTQPAQGYYLGDMDANGAVESLDVTYILRYLAQLAYPDTCQCRR